MSVFKGVAGCVMVPYSGAADPRSPRSWWYSSDIVNGDSSGGVIQWTFTLRPDGKASNDLWSLEGIGLISNDGGNSGDVVYRWQAFERDVGTSGAYQATGYMKVVRAPSVRNAAIGSDQVVRHPPGHQNTTAPISLVVEWSPNTNAKAYECRPWGYIWDGEANDAGGPIRPQ